MRIALVVLAVLAAGCVTPAVDDAPVDPAPPRPVRFPCPEGPHYEPAPSVCAGTLGGEEENWGEPFVAAAGAGAFVVAAQGSRATANALDEVSVGGVDALLDSPACVSGFRVCLFVTEDHGATWDRREPATADVPPPVVDPIAAFADGRLFVGGLDGGGGITVAWSSDRGRTWDGASTAASGDGTDRPWLGVAGQEALLVWQTSGKTEGFVRASADGTATWGPVHELPCNLFSRPYAVEDGSWRFACRDASHTVVYAFSDAPREIARLEGSTGTLHMTKGVDGRLWLVQPMWVDGVPTVGVFQSDDAGASWRGPFDLRSALEAAAGWDWIWSSWAEADPWGDLHVLVAGGEGESCFHGTCDDADLRRSVHHVHVAGGLGSAVAHRLTPDAESAGDRPWATDRDPVRDDFHGVACNADECLAAWAYDSLLDWSLIRPAT